MYRAYVPVTNLFPGAKIAVEPHALRDLEVGDNLPVDCLVTLVGGWQLANTAFLPGRGAARTCLPRLTVRAPTAC